MQMPLSPILRTGRKGQYRSPCVSVVGDSTTKERENIEPDMSGTPRRLLGAHDRHFIAPLNFDETDIVKKVFRGVKFSMWSSYS